MVKMSCDNFDKFSEEVDTINNNSEVPVWAKVLIGCFKNFINEIKSISVQQLAIISQLEDKSKVQNVVTDSLNAENERLRGEIKVLKDAVDRNEQVSRSSNLLLHGVPEEINEVTDDICCRIISEKLNIEISVNDIARSHRLGAVKSQMSTRKSKPYARPIIVKFVNLRKRLEVFRSKRYLKGSNIIITENLTKKRYDLYREAMTKLGKGNVWTSDGKILSKSGNSIIVISSPDDLKS